MNRGSRLIKRILAGGGMFTAFVLMAAEMPEASTMQFVMAKIGAAVLAASVFGLCRKLDAEGKF